jgi:hypothetical protein
MTGATAVGLVGVGIPGQQPILVRLGAAERLQHIAEPTSGLLQGCTCKEERAC